MYQLMTIKNVKQLKEICYSDLYDSRHWLTFINSIEHIYDTAAGIGFYSKRNDRGLLQML